MITFFICLAGAAVVLVAIIWIGMQLIEKQDIFK